MNIEEQVTNIRLSKRLRELGVKQESLFYWGQRKYPSSIAKDKLFKEDLFYGDQEPGLKVLASAFTVAELGKMLPLFVSCKGKNVYYISFGYKDSSEGEGVFREEVQADTEADARAKMLIYLLENKLLEARNDTT